MLVVLVLATSAIVFAAAARAKCAGKIAVAGTVRADVMKGTRRPNVFNGLKGNDKLYGLGGADKLCGGAGSDTIAGAGGKDVLAGAGGNDKMNGGGSADTLKGAGGRDSLKGAGGNDKLVGGPGKDVLDGGSGFDTCSQGERYISCERILPLVIQEVSLGISNSSFDIPATNLAPGDQIARILDLRNSSSVSIGVLALTTTAAPSTPLTGDPTDGLQMTLERCSVPWAQAGADYSCSGSLSTILSSRPVIVTDVSLTGLNSLQAGGVDHLLVRLSLPPDAGQHVAGASSVVTYTFNA